jgi:hypothetical protein
MLAPGPDFAPRIPQVPEPGRIQTLVSDQRQLNFRADDN